MEPVHPQFKEGATLGVFFGVFLTAVLVLAAQSLNSWWTEKAVITSVRCGSATQLHFGPTTSTVDKE